MTFSFLALALIDCQPIQPLAAVQEAATLPVVVAVTAARLMAPDEMRSGIVTGIYKNSSDTDASPGLVWMSEGSTVADFEKAVQEEDFLAIFTKTIIAGTVELAPATAKRATMMERPAKSSSPTSPTMTRRRSRSAKSPPLRS
jgi:hypothetical protein